LCVESPRLLRSMVGTGRPRAVFRSLRRFPRSSHTRRSSSIATLSSSSSIEVVDNLGDKVGPLLLQFSFFKSSVFRGVNVFLPRLRPFLKKLPKDRKFAVEIRNKHWLVPPFIETLRENRVALALIDPPRHCCPAHAVLPSAPGKVCQEPVYSEPRMALMWCSCD
jgi:uncharacterized protein YecE (DUF72 family)